MQEGRWAYYIADKLGPGPFSHRYIIRLHVKTASLNTQRSAVF